MSDKLKELEEYIENENRIGDLQYCHYSLIIDNTNAILKKQLASNHHIECNCSFCKPVDTQSKEDLEDYNKMVKVGINAN